MSQWIPFSSGGGSITNLNTTYEQVGLGSGDGTVITTAAANTKGSYVQLTASTINNWAGFWLSLGPASASGTRYLLDISFDGGTTVAVPNLFIQPGAILSGQGPMFFVPLNVPSGSDFRVRAQASTGTNTFRMAVLGVVRTSASRPLFNACTALNAADTTSTYPGAISIPLTDAWTEITASTAGTYGALLSIHAASGNATTPQTVGIAIGTGAAASEVEMIRWICGYNSSSPALRGATSVLVETSVAAGTRVAARCYGSTPNSDAILGQIFGFS